MKILSELGERNTYEYSNSDLFFNPHKIVYEKYIDNKIQKRNNLDCI